ncbi:hypothetical protein LCGC14_3144080 [marine sediment metagenome]|uniref:Uncharacterized protein n=1 Tax=marine sediment metagenome TaxID=412755 RepID=A0A0F8VW52_9ZZZZ
MGVMLSIRKRYWKFEEGLIKWCRVRFKSPRKELKLETFGARRGWEADPKKYKVIRKMTWGDCFRRLLERVLEPSNKRWCKRLKLPEDKIPTEREWEEHHVRYAEWQKIVKGE